jgi:hypothetical protein
MADALYDSRTYDYGSHYGAVGIPPALTTRSVSTVPVSSSTGYPVSTSAPGAGLSAAQLQAMRNPGTSTSGTQYFPNDGSYGYNATSGAYEPRTAGNAYSAGGTGLPPNWNFSTRPGTAAGAAAAVAKPGFNWPQFPFGQGGGGMGLSFGDKFSNAIAIGAMKAGVPGHGGPRPFGRNNITVRGGRPDPGRYHQYPPSVPPPMSSLRAGTNGYIYQAMPDGTFKQVGKDPNWKPQNPSSNPPINMLTSNGTGAGRDSGGGGTTNSMVPSSVSSSTRWTTGY